MNKLLLKLSTAWDKQISYVFCSSILLFILQSTFIEINFKNISSRQHNKYASIAKTRKPIVDITTTDATKIIQINLQLEKPSNVEIQLFDQNGKIAETNEETFLSQGKHTLKIAPSIKGNYLLTLLINHEIVYRKIITDNL